MSRHFRLYLSHKPKLCCVLVFCDAVWSCLLRALCHYCMLAMFPLCCSIFFLQLTSSSFGVVVGYCWLLFIQHRPFPQPRQHIKPFPVALIEALNRICQLDSSSSKTSKTCVMPCGNCSLLILCHCSHCC